MNVSFQLLMHALGVQRAFNTKKYSRNVSGKVLGGR